MPIQEDSVLFKNENDDEKEFKAALTNNRWEIIWSRTARSTFQVGDIVEFVPVANQFKLTARNNAGADILGRDIELSYRDGYSGCRFTVTGPCFHAHARGLCMVFTIAANGKLKYLGSFISGGSSPDEENDGDPA